MSLGPDLFFQQSILFKYFVSNVIVEYNNNLIWFHWRILECQLNFHGDLFFFRVERNGFTFSNKFNGWDDRKSSKWRAHNSVSMTLSWGYRFHRKWWWRRWWWWQNESVTWLWSHLLKVCLFYQIEFHFSKKKSGKIKGIFHYMFKLRRSYIIRVTHF